MRYEFHPEALREYRQATTWYAERDRRVALEFVEAVEDAINRILEAPTRWRVIEEDIRRCLTHVFLTQFFTQSNRTTC
jgi:plasmid stabilization system protein ParE